MNSSRNHANSSHNKKISKESNLPSISDPKIRKYYNKVINGLTAGRNFLSILGLSLAIGVGVTLLFLLFIIGISIAFQVYDGGVESVDWTIQRVMSVAEMYKFAPLVVALFAIIMIRK